MMFGQSIPYTKSSARPRDYSHVTGAVTHQAGIKVKRPGDNGKSRNMLVEQRKLEELTRNNLKISKETYDLIGRHEFDQVTERKGLANKMRRGVAAGLEAMRRDLEVRRDKLRCLLLEEEESWTKECLEKSRRDNEKKLEDMRIKVEEIRNKRETERQKVVQEKRIQQYIERCEDLRTMKLQRFAQETKRGQESQIREHEYIKEQEREVERIWAEIARNEHKAKIAREIEEARKKFQRDREVAEILLLQKKSIEARNVTERQRIKDEEVNMKEKIQKEIIEEKKKALENKIRTREKIFNDLMQQIKKREEFLNSMSKDEELLEKMFRRVAQAELEKEITFGKKYKETLKREYQMYCDSVEELRKRRASEEAELEKILQQERNRIDEERKESMMRLKAAHQKLKEEVLQGRKIQVEQHKETAEKLRKEEEEEHKLQEMVRLQNARLAAEHDNQIRLLKQKYAKDLMDQIEYSKTLKIQEREDMEREWKSGLLEEERYKRLLKELISRGETMEPHPFYKIIEGSASIDGPYERPVNEAKVVTGPNI